MKGRFLISSFKVSGFRSLQNFSMRLRPGLNVLVGPNGAGKTNIVDALELLSLLCEKPVGEAVGQLGGTGAIVAKASDDTYASQVRFEVVGDRLISREKYLEFSHASLAGRSSLRGLRWARYRYDLVISIDKDRVHVKEESLAVWLNKTRRTKGEIRPVAEPSQKVDYVVNRKGDHSGELRAAVAMSTVAANFSDYYYNRRFQDGLSDSSSGDTTGEKTFMWHARQVGRSFFINRFLDDFSLGAPFNIAPSRVRQSMDISSAPVLQRDGYGFGAALWALQKGSVDRQGDKAHQSVEKLVSYAQRANPNIRSISAELDPWDSKFRVAVEIYAGGTSKEATVKVPLASLSDGTLKWLALMMAVITGVRMLAIEEPENYVHPAIQKALVEILRERFSDAAESQEFILLTTHSETLLNALLPDEIEVVSMSEGQTTVARLADAKSLMDEIRKTGFGLGHFYMMGALDG